MAETLEAPSNVISLHASKALRQAAYIEPQTPTVGAAIAQVREASRMRAFGQLADAIGIAAEAQGRNDRELALRAAALLEHAASVVAGELRLWAQHELTVKGGE